MSNLYNYTRPGRYIHYPILLAALLQVTPVSFSKTIFLEHPNDININRGNAGDHIAFGQGIHFCPGAMLARKEMNVALVALLSRLNNIQIVEEKSDLTYWPNIVLRGLKGLHISFEKRVD